MLRISGGDRIFTDFAAAIAGHRRGGPAKVAVISSALMGMLSGSSISNVSTTGTMTIPMMKRMGFKHYQAAAVEVVSSVGGGLMPPLMGTGIFIMASLANVPLLDILYYSTAPAILYFAAIYFYVDIKASKHGFVGLPKDELPGLKPALLGGGHIFLPIIHLGRPASPAVYTPYFASAACVVLTILVVSFLRAPTRMDLAKVLVALEAGARVALTIAALIVSAAVIYGVMVHTGLLNKVTSIVISFSGGYSAVAIVLIGLSVLRGWYGSAGYRVLCDHRGAWGRSAARDGYRSLGGASHHFLVRSGFHDNSADMHDGVRGRAHCGRAPNADRVGVHEDRKIPLHLAVHVRVFQFSRSLLQSRVLFDFLLALLMFALLPAAIDGYWRWPLRIPGRASMFITTVCLFMATIGTDEGLAGLVGIFDVITNCLSLSGLARTAICFEMNLE